MIAYNYCYLTCLGRVADFQGRNKLGVTDLDLPPGLLEKLQDHIASRRTKWHHIRQAYGDYDGRKSIRILVYRSQPVLPRFSVVRQPCSAIHAGHAMVLGCRSTRNVPNVDPAYEGGGATPTYEFYPSRGPATVMNFMITTSGLNSELVAVRWKIVTIDNVLVLWDPDQNIEAPLPDMPNGVVRVYPASGAVAMLPLTPATNYTPTLLFCGGSDMPADYYGNCSWPFYNTWTYPTSKDCQRLTPEPQDGSSPAYDQDDPMLLGRTMGRFINLPDGTMLVINGAANGTAGFANQTLYIPSLARFRRTANEVPRAQKEGAADAHINMARVDRWEPAAARKVID
ncbi:hypothetical protein JVT61DRAFT_14978 [Boletus reticuloceps]|uniref:Glyoxal oxidase N-terminal domain-containing protein n=1 Tax=Boletus reticuloceps TaxID=495285 RepID=A0A8I2YCJ5_9AGAM|nr:hypothetical protein JVT61DRAFT_14978 [Boletus reticuloceps]